MRVQRHPSRLSFRRQPRRRPGCLSLTFLMGLALGAFAMSWTWLGERLPFAARPAAADHSGQAAAAFARGDLDSAIDEAEAAIEQQPEDAAALLLLVRALVYRSYADIGHDADRERALANAEDALRRDPTNGLYLAAQAYALQALGRPVQAAQTAEDALRRTPGHGLARVARALSYGAVGSFQAALRESEEVAALPEWQLEGLRAAAISLSDLGDYRRALEINARAIALNRYLTPLYFERALFALQVGNTDEATAAYYQVLTYDTENIKARLRLCELSSTLREREAALHYCQQVTERAPSWAPGWYQLGLEFFLQGSFAAARDALHRCSSLQVMQNVPVEERKFECWYLQGQAAEILGDCDSLVATYNEFRAMAKDAAITQTWTYPPEGPPGCTAGGN